ncbi:hypothetical protein FJV41_16090 [Myxococcus llanfairpwllgwyngyllgogerychwyrndrobwllllantysiliogogogochensis]|uniref:Exonuclease VII large subunit C-terminal domain-containing protein n=1 Tax=Myxococcus llanfairpwllgwyngyllgogerychwyrndrobwllllantysiliogogogochensis TaxID=2590453 RepID=A0A540X0W0_9BACT|nr:exodeoxyribonuclease VII large subunit [Myxococcus llanfairpwllgwyngyllgogerychwyrndrobwllllantysiliogogogochensis]TQF14911.1 hypothetical protein FJV41_16090 [Myxococcus llanfairpwllgwyngyllgogerychwyrndrobwllllantysiliogogogochensis]
MKGIRRSTGRGRSSKKKSQFQAVARDAHGPSHFEAEVISVRSGDHGYCFLWLLRTSDDVNINAMLSSHLALPQEGDMVLVWGGFEENPKAKTLPKPVRLRVTSITQLGRKSARHNEWSDALKSVLVGHVPMKETRTIRRPVIVTGRNTAGETDIRNELKGAESLDPGFPMFEYVDLNAPESIAAGVRQAARVSDVRAIVLARGGTSEKWQLLPFSHPAVVRAVAEVAKFIPVVVAIGHADDHPLCEQSASFTVTAPSAVGSLFRILNQEREDRLRRDAVEKAHARPGYEGAARGANAPAQSQLRSEDAGREANVPVQTPSDSRGAVPDAPRTTSWRRHRWKLALTGLVALSAVVGMATWGLSNEAPTEAPPPHAPAAVVTTVAPVQPAPPKRKKTKPKAKPIKEVPAGDRGTADAGRESSPAATEAPQALNPIDVFE